MASTDCVNGVLEGDGSCTCTAHWTGARCDDAYKHVVWGLFLPINLCALALCAVLCALAAQQIALQLRVGPGDSWRQRWTVKVSVLVLVCVAAFVRVVYYLISEYFGLFDVDLAPGGDVVLFEVPLILLVTACLQIALYWLELTDPSAQRTARRVLVVAALLYPAVALVLAVYIGADVRHSQSVQLGYNVWLSLWMFAIAGGFLLWGRRLRLILRSLADLSVPPNIAAATVTSTTTTSTSGVAVVALPPPSATARAADDPGSAARASYARVSYFMGVIAVTAVTTIVLILLATVAGFYFHPWSWIVCVGINRGQEIVVMLTLVLALSQTGKGLAAQQHERAAAMGLALGSTAAYETATVDDDDPEYHPNGPYDSAPSGSGVRSVAIDAAARAAGPYQQQRQLQQQHASRLPAIMSPMGDDVLPSPSLGGDDSSGRHSSRYSGDQPIGSLNAPLLHHSHG